MILKYINVHQSKVRWVKHYFYNKENKYSICGVGIIWYSPERWSMDKEGLEERRLCGRCVNIRKRQDAVQS
jgi:hypothetical protein